jgi:hypothetical protein
MAAKQKVPERALSFMAATMLLVDRVLKASEIPSKTRTSRLQIRGAVMSRAFPNLGYLIPFSRLLFDFDQDKSGDSKQLTILLRSLKIDRLVQTGG